MSDGLGVGVVIAAVLVSSLTAGVVRSCEINEEKKQAIVSEVKDERVSEN